MAVSINNSGITFPDTTTQTTRPVMELVSSYTATGADTVVSVACDLSRYTQFLLLVTNLSTTSGQPYPNNTVTLYGPGSFQRTTGTYASAAFLSGTPFSSNAYTTSYGATFYMYITPDQLPPAAGSYAYPTLTGLGLSDKQIRFSGSSQQQRNGSEVGIAFYMLNAVSALVPFTFGTVRLYGFK